MTKRVPIASDFRRVDVSFIRPADTTAYTIGDVVCNSTSNPAVMQIQNLGVNRIAGGGYSGVIKEVLAISSANNTTLPDLRLWIFDVAPAAVNDNAAFAPTDNEMLNLVTILAFPNAAWMAGNSAAAASGNAVCNAQALEISFNTAGPNNILYAVVVSNNAYTPVSAEQFTFRFKATQ